MPIPSSALETDSFLRVLLMGGPKAGKTTCAVCTAPGPVRILLCEADSALQSPRRKGAVFDFERVMDTVKPYEQMTTFLVEAKASAKAGDIKTLIIDPFSKFAERLLGQSMKLNLTNNGEEDGRRGYPHYTKRLLHCLDLAFTVPCHLIVISHYQDFGGESMGMKKVGDGIVPLIPGSARARVAADFNDVLWFDVDKADPDKRVFITRPTGAWGPGCRSLSAEYTTVPADFSALIELFRSEGIKKPTKTTAAPPKSNGGVVKPPMKTPARPAPPVRR